MAIPYTKTLSEIIASIEAQTTVEGQATVLRENSSPALKAILSAAMHPSAVWYLPEGAPPYKSAPPEQNSEQAHVFYSEARKLIYFYNTPDGAALKPARREYLFVQMLEMVSAEDAKLLLRVKDKALTIIPEAVALAFPKVLA